jgi:hypothetical protein
MALSPARRGSRSDRPKEAGPRGVRRP